VRLSKRTCFERLCLFFAFLKLFFFYLVVKLFTLPAVFCLVNKDLQNHYTVTIVIEGAEISWRGSVYVSSRSAGEQPARSEEEQVHQH